MTAPDMSDVCKQYIRSMIQGDLRSAFQSLSLVEDKELFRALAVPARDDIDDLFDAEPEAPVGFAPEIPGIGGIQLPAAQRAALGAALLGGQVLTRLAQTTYAYNVVKNGKVKFAKDAVPPTAKAGVWAKDYVHHCVTLHKIPLDIDEDLTGKLPARLLNPPAITEANFVSAAGTLGVDVAVMKAVAQVESAGSGFGSDGRPVIRYELHRFQSKTQSHFRKTHPHLSQSGLATGAPYHNGTQDREYSLLYNAMLLLYKGERTIEEAIESTSWGKFQVMGENWSRLGWSSALQFASDMYASEANHLKAFVKFVQSNGLTNALKKHQWATFAAGYNGPSYEDNEYDDKLERAFNRFDRSKSAAAHP